MCFNSTTFGPLSLYCALEDARYSPKVRSCKDLTFIFHHFPSFLPKGDGHGPRRHRWLCGWHLTSLIDGKVGATTIANANHQHLDCLGFHHLSHWCKKTMRLGWSPCKLGSNFTYCSSSISQYILQFTTVFLVFFIFFSFSFSSWETTKSGARETFSAKCESEEVMNVPTETASVCVLMWRLGLGWRS